MLASIFLRYILPMLVAASLASYATHKITVNAYKAEELAALKTAEEDKDKIDVALNDVSKEAEVTKEKQDVVKEKIRIKYETVIKTEYKYIDVACTLPTSGVRLIDDNAKAFNDTRKSISPVQATPNVH